MERGVSSSKKNRILSKALRMSHSCQQRLEKPDWSCRAQAGSGRTTDKTGVVGLGCFTGDMSVACQKSRLVFTMPPQRGPAEWTEDDFLRDSGDGVTEPALLSDDQLSQTLHCARPPPGPPQLPLPPFRLC
ncbi:hypothetical protein MHYP_G00222310 [Metynnis hypsauchen]